MGCDIHLFVEVAEDETWTMIDHPDVLRNYTLFEKMAGVRGNPYNALAQPRGLPDDVSRGTKLHYNYGRADAHTESYLSLDEIYQLEKWMGEALRFKYPLGFSFGNGFGLDEDCIGDNRISDIRLVFWFDN